jgi:hypothetical protein
MFIIPKLNEISFDHPAYNRVLQYWDLYVPLSEVIQFIQDWDWKVSKITNGGTRGTPYTEIDTREFLINILMGKSQFELGKIYGVSSGAISSRFSKIPEFTDQRNTTSTGAVKVLRFFGLKKCCRCKGILWVDEGFGNSKGRIDGKTSQCKTCSRLAYIDWGKENKEYIIQKRKEVYAPGTEKHRKKLEDTREWKLKNNYRGRNNPSYLLRRPKNVNMKRMNKIYRECPAGFHVDHIIPLKGKLVSGLDIPENLQYLSAEENMKKSNSFTPCSYEDIPKGLY